VTDPERADVPDRLTDVRRVDELPAHDFSPERTGIDEVYVVVPARNEETTIAASLAAIDRAIEALGDEAPPVRVIVVLDRCTDGTEDLARASGAECVISTIGRVGGARRLGIERALAVSAAGRHIPLDRVWIANTDADSAVPTTWLRHHLHRARSGCDALVGIVSPRAEDLTSGELVVWKARHRFGRDHEHVFGANLGVRASAYRSVGGFEDIATGEDVRLVEALDASGANVHRGQTQPVHTSGRRLGRAPEGFADYLSTLDDVACESR
jgi:glycosyltransferase involved in cell wall biosynthesis